MIMLTSEALEWPPLVTAGGRPYPMPSHAVPVHDTSVFGILAHVSGACCTLMLMMAWESGGWLSRH